MSNKIYKTLDLEKLNRKKSIITSSEKSLKEISPNWSDDILSGKKKVIISYSK